MQENPLDGMQVGETKETVRALPGTFDEGRIRSIAGEIAQLL